MESRRKNAMGFETLTEALAYWAEQTPGKRALIEIETGRYCSYRELFDNARGFAELLSAHAIPKGSRIAIKVGGLIETNVVMFGTFLYGCVYCPLERNIKEPKLREFLSEYNASVLVADNPIEWHGLTVDIAQATALNGTADFELPTADTDAIVVFTTGTTGKAKGVVHTHRTHIRCAFGWVNELGFGQNDTFLSVQPLERAGGMFHYYCAILAGGTAAHHNGVVFARRVYDAIREYGITTAYLQSPALTMLLDALTSEIGNLSDQLRLLMTGGAAVSETLKRKLAALLPKTELHVFYGATENQWLSYYRFDNNPGKVNCVGRAAHGNKIYIINECGNETDWTATRESPGVIAVESDGNFKEYLNAPELTETVLKNGRLLMTDMGYADDEGYIYLLGRRDDVIVTGGYKVAPYEIEEVALRYDGVSECACIGVDDKVLGHAIKLFVKMAVGYEFSAAKIAKFLGQHLETYKVPRFITDVDDFPRMGDVPKINRKELKRG
jgi:long-chain acyl-CoA synthetase